jgi:hypothetical protein
MVRGGYEVFNFLDLSQPAVPTIDSASQRTPSGRRLIGWSCAEAVRGCGFGLRPISNLVEGACRRKLGKEQSCLHSRSFGGPGKFDSPFAVETPL